MRRVLAAALLAALISTASAEQQVIDVNPIIELFADQLCPSSGNLRQMAALI